MANLTENTAEFSPVYKIEKTDAVIGGDGLDDIANKQTHALMKRDNYLKEQSELLGKYLAKALIKNYIPDTLLILWGCDITVNIPGTSAIEEGAIFYNDRVYPVLADASISSPTDTLVFNLNTTAEPHFIELLNDETGEGLADYNSSAVRLKLQNEFVAIGTWNLNSTATKTLAHGLGANYKKIIDIKVRLIGDDGTTVVILGTRLGDTSQLPSVNFDATNIYIFTDSNAEFASSANWDGAQDRGKVIIEYGDL